MARAAATEAALFAQELRSEIRRIVRDELAQLEGAHRGYAWMIGDPATATTPPAPFGVELAQRPVDVIAACLTAPSATVTCDVQRSIDSGATFASMLQTPTTLGSGQRFGRGATFKWEVPDTRALVAPTTEGALPLVLRPGDVIKLVLSPTTANGAKSLTVQLRVQRVGEYARRGQ
jgi:hypothetical protein